LRINLHSKLFRTMSKEVKSVLRGLRRYADPPSSFEIRCKKHFRVSWEMLDDDGMKVTVRTTIGWSPSDPYWRNSHKQQLRRRFNELNISTEVTHI
jgi:hypothetical protein